MPKTLQHRRKSTSELNSITGSVGEIFIDTNKNTIRVMNGTTVGGTELARTSDLTTLNNTLTSLISTKANTSSVYTKTQIDSALEQKVQKINIASGTVGSATAIPSITYNSQGQITSVSETEIELNNLPIYDGELTVRGAGVLTGSGTFNANQNNDSVITISHGNITRTDQSSSGTLQFGQTVQFLQGLDTSEQGHVISARTKSIIMPSETVTSLQLIANMLSYVDESGTQTNIDLSLYIDDANLSRIVGGIYDEETNSLIFTREDGSTFTIDASAFFNVESIVTSVNGQTGEVFVQETLVPGVNLKTVCGESLLGPGNINLDGNGILERLESVQGSGSGLDADLLDGEQGTYYLNYDNLTNKPNVYLKSESYSQEQILQILENAYNVGYSSEVSDLRADDVQAALDALSEESKWWSNINSATRLYGGVIQDNGDGTVRVASGGGLYKIEAGSISGVAAGECEPMGLNTAQGGKLFFSTWEEQLNVPLTNHAYNYIFIVWDHTIDNGDGTYGNTTIVANTNFYMQNWEDDPSYYAFKDAHPELNLPVRRSAMLHAHTVGRVYKMDNEIIIRVCGTNAWNFNKRVQLFGEEFFPVIRARGLDIEPVSDSLQFNVTAGIMWAEMANRFTIQEFNMENGDTFTAWYQHTAENFLGTFSDINYLYPYGISDAPYDILYSTIDDRYYRYQNNAWTEVLDYINSKVQSETFDSLTQLQTLYPNGYINNSNNIDYVVLQHQSVNEYYRYDPEETLGTRWKYFGDKSAVDGYVVVSFLGDVDQMDVQYPNGYNSVINIIAPTNDLFYYEYSGGLGWVRVHGYVERNGWLRFYKQDRVDPNRFNNPNTNQLLDITNGMYGVAWIYMCHDNTCHVVYGQGEYTQEGAKNASLPLPLPGMLAAYSTLVGKMTFAFGASAFENAESPFLEKFVSSGVALHNDLSGLDGGSASQNKYYHLDETQYNSVKNLVTGTYYTGQQVYAAIGEVIDSAPSSLNTLKELADALGNDDDFSTTVTNHIATKVSKILSVEDFLPKFSGNAGDLQLSGVRIDDSNVVYSSGLAVSNGDITISKDGYYNTITSSSINLSDNILNTTGLNLNNKVILNSSTGNATFKGNIQTGPLGNNGNIYANTIQLTGNYLQFGNTVLEYYPLTNDLTINNKKIWTEQNDGFDSGLDADKLDGYHASQLQILLESGINIKTVNGLSLLGSGNLTVAGGTSAVISVNGMIGAVELDIYTDEDIENILSGGTLSTIFLNNNNINMVLNGDSLSFTNGGITKAYINGSTGSIQATSMSINNNTVWHAGNDGSGSGLDADLLDGHDSSYYQNNVIVEW